MPTPFQTLHARYRREAEAEKPTAKRRTRRAIEPPATSATEEPPATEATREEDDR